MSVTRAILRAYRVAGPQNVRTFTSTRCRFVDLNSRANDTAEQYRKFQMDKPLNPHMTNTNSTIANEMPSIGKDGPPPELISSVDPNYVPKDSKPEKTDRMTGGTQKASHEGEANEDLNVGEIEGGTFRIEPLRRTGEDANTMRARLLCKTSPSNQGPG